MHDKLEEQKKEQLLREKDLENKRLTDLLKWKDESIKSKEKTEKLLVSKLAEKPTTVVLHTTNNTTNEYHTTDNLIVDTMEIDNSVVENNTTNIVHLSLIESPGFDRFQACLRAFNDQFIANYSNRGIQGLKEYQIDLTKAIMSSNDPEFIHIGEALVDDEHGNYIDIEDYRQEMRKHLFDEFVEANPDDREPVIKLLMNEPLLKI